MDIKKMIEEINAGGYGFTIETAGAGWVTKYVAVDRQTSEATPVSGEDIAAKYKQLGLGISSAASALGSIKTPKANIQRGNRGA